MSKQYRVWMRIRGNLLKPPYDGYCDVYAHDEEQARERAIAKVRRAAHWDSPVSDFKIERVEIR